MASRSVHIMLVAAHPADSFDQAGGTLAHHVAQGDRVTVVLATTGVRTHHFRLVEEKRKRGADLDVEACMREAVEEKLEEVRKACRILGYDDVRDLGFEDDDMILTQKMVEAIAEMIRQVKPDILITHHPYECGGLKMHGTVGQATIYAWQVAAGCGHGRQLRHHVPSIYFMNPLAYMGINSLEYGGMARADLYVDITDVIDKKVQALDCIGSQSYSGPFARKRAETEDGAHGGRSGLAYAEQFQRFTPLVRYTLPITDAELDRIHESGEVTVLRRGEIVGGLVPLPENGAFSSRYRMPKEMYDE